MIGPMYCCLLANHLLQSKGTDAVSIVQGQQRIKIVHLCLLSRTHFIHEKGLARQAPKNAGCHLLPSKGLVQPDLCDQTCKTSEYSVKIASGPEAFMMFAFVISSPPPQRFPSLSLQSGT